MIKGVCGGAMIGIASYIYLMTGGIVGAFLFSIGLLTILNMNFKLYTGAVGFAKKHDVPSLAAILLGNIIGTCLLFAFPLEAALPLVLAKLSISLPIVFLKAIICGIFMYAAVSSFCNGKDYMVPVSVVGFILAGGEHCIADMCYFIAARYFSLDVLLFIIVVIAGNSLGSILVDKIKDL